MYEAYFAGDLDFKGDVLETLRNHRREFLCVTRERGFTQ
jgi:hypothetical protein